MLPIVKCQNIKNSLILWLHISFYDLICFTYSPLHLTDAKKIKTN